MMASPGIAKENAGISLPDNISRVETERPRVAVILPRGETLRNFVYTNALDAVGEQADLSLLAVIPDESFRCLLTDRYGDVSEIEQLREPWPVRITREILDVAHGRWLWSAAARERWRLRDIEANTASKWLKRLAKKLICTPLANRPSLAFLSGLESGLSQRASTSQAYVRLFESMKPSLLFNSSHVHSQIAMPAVHAARVLGIPTAAFLFSWDNLTSQGRIMPPYDYYLVWNEAIRNQLLDIYRTIDPNQVFVTGTPQFDFHFKQEFFWSREEFCKAVGADPMRPIVLYSTGMANHMPDEPLIVEQIADQIAGMQKFGPPQLMVRVYAKDTTGRFEELKRRRPDILFPEVPWEKTWLTPKFEDNYVLTNMLKHCALGINIASTISLELCMFDKPVVNVGYNPVTVPRTIVDYAGYYEFDHYRPVVESGAVRVAGSEQELGELVHDALVKPERYHENRQTLVAQMFGDMLDGRSGQRIAERIIQLARDQFKRKQSCL